MEKDKRPLRKYTLRLFDGDPAVLDRFFPDVGHNAVIRAVVNRLCQRLQEKLNRKLTAKEGLDLGNEIARGLIEDEPRIDHNTIDRIADSAGSSGDD